ncbi:MAG: MarR family transcriptional regulator [Chloroflexota bacterium]|nr:MarR family transcriptional regulator [Chloroflexota bacterium]
MSSILLDLHVAYHALDRLLQRELAGVGVSMSEALVLRLLVLNPRVTIAALRQSTGLAPSTLSSLVGRLVERGLVRRRRLAGDRRSRVVFPTSVGRGVGLIVDSSLAELQRRMADLPYATAWPDASELASVLTTLDRPPAWSRLD